MRGRGHVTERAEACVRPRRRIGFGDLAGDAIVDQLIAAHVDALALGVIGYVRHQTRGGIERIDIIVGDGSSVRDRDGFHEFLRAPRKRAVDRQLTGVGKIVLGEVGELLFMHRCEVAHHTIALFEDATHKRGGNLIPAEVAHALHEVFLVVLKPVVVKVDIARDLPEQFIDRNTIAGAVIAGPGTVHAAGDIDARETLNAIDTIGNPGRVAKLEVGELVAVNGRHGLARRQIHRQTGVGRFPGVWQPVLVGIDRARVEAAAAHAAGDRILRFAVDKAHCFRAGREDAALRFEYHLPFIEEIGAPGLTLIEVGQTVAVGIFAVVVANSRSEPCTGVGGEELVEPSFEIAGVVGVDGCAIAVGVAGIGAGEFVGVVELVGVVVKVDLLLRVLFVVDGRRSVRAAVGVEFPAVGHAVAVGIRAVSSLNGAGAAGSGKRLGEPLGDNRRLVRLDDGLHGRVLDGISGCSVGAYFLGCFGHLYLNRREDYVRVRRFRQHRGPRVVEAGFLEVIDDIVIAAVLHDEVFVVRLVGTSIDSHTRRIEGHELFIYHRIPAAGHIAFAVLVPCGARIVAKSSVDLIVDEGVGQEHIHPVARDKLDLHPVDILDHEIAPHPILEHLGLGIGGRTVHIRPQAVAQNLSVVFGIGLRFAVHRNRRQIANNRPGQLIVVDDRTQAVADEELEARRFGILNRRVRVDIARHAEGIEEGHEIAVGVAVLAAVERVERVHDLPAVAHMIAVGIPMAGVRAKHQFFKIGKAVVVEIGMVGIILGWQRIAGVEALFNFRGRNFLAHENIEHTEALEGELLACARLALAGGRPNMRLIPEVVFPAVGEAVAVGIVEGRVHARVARAARFRAPDREIRRIGIEAVRIREGLPGLLLILAEADVGCGKIGRVQAVVETAQLEARIERHTYGRVAVPAVLDERDHAFLIKDARQVVVVGVAGIQSLDVGLDVFRAVDEVDEFAALPILDDKDVGDAVLVDIAEVIGGEPFLREDGLDDRVEIAAVLGLLRREHHRTGADHARTFRGDRVAENRARDTIAALADAVENPAVEVRVLDLLGLFLVVRVEVGHRVVERIRDRAAGRSRTVLVEGDVHAIEGAVVVRTGHLVAEAVDVHVDVLRAVPLQAEVLRGGEDRVGDIGVAHADTIAERVLLGERGSRRAAGRTGRDRREELRRRDRELPGPGQVAAILILDREDDVLVTLRGAEVRIERVARGLVHEELGCVRAAREADLDALERRNAREIGVDVALDLPTDAVVLRHAARDFIAVRVLRRADHADGLDVVDEDTRRIFDIVLVRRRVGRRQDVGRDDLGLDDEAVERGDFRTIHRLDHEIDRKRIADLDLIRVDAGRVVAVQLEFTRVRTARAVLLDRDTDLELAREERIPVAELDLDLARVVVLDERLRSDHFDLRVIEHGDADRVGDVGPVLHVLILDLELDRPVTRTREVIGERILGRIAGDHVVFDRADTRERRRPLALERFGGVGQVVLALIGNDCLELLGHALRDLVREHSAIALGLEAVHLDTSDLRLEVVDRNVQVVRIIARETLGRIVVLGAAEHDLEGEAETARVLAESVEEHDLAGGRLVLVVVDRETGRLRQIGVVADHEVRRGAEHGRLGVVAGEQERVDRAARVVLLGDGDLEGRLLAFVVDVVLVVGRDDVGGAGLLDVSDEVDDLALLAAQRGNDVDLAGETFAGTRVLDNRKIGGGEVRARLRAVILHAVKRIALADVIEAVEQRVGVGTAVLDVDFITGSARRVLEGGIGERVAHRDDEGHLVTADAGDLRALGRRRDDRSRRTDFHTGRRHLVDDRRRRCVKDLRREHHAGRTRGVRIAAETEDVDLLLGRGAGRDTDRDLVAGTAGRQRRHLVLRRGEADVITPVSRRTIREGGLDLDIDGAILIGLGEIDRKERTIGHVVAVSIGNEAVGLDNGRRGHRLDTLDGNGDVVDDTGTRRRLEGVVIPRAEDELRGVALLHALNCEVGLQLATREGDRTDLRGCADGIVARIVTGDHVLDCAATDLDHVVIHRPDIERDRVFRGRGSLKGRRTADRDGRVLVNCAPEVLGLPLLVEADGLHIEAAVRKRVVRHARAIRGRGRAVRRPVIELAGVAGVVRDRPLAGTRRVEQILERGIRIRRGTVGRRENDREREVARTRLVLEDEIRKARRGIGRRIDQRGVTELA